MRIFLGAILARGRQTVTSSNGANGVNPQYRLRDRTLGAAGKRADNIANRPVDQRVKPLVAGHRRLAALVAAAFPSGIGR